LEDKPSEDFPAQIQTSPNFQAVEEGPLDQPPKEAVIIEALLHAHGETSQNHTPAPPQALLPSPLTIQTGNFQTRPPPPLSPPPPAPNYAPPPQALRPHPLSLTRTRTIATQQSQALPQTNMQPPVEETADHLLRPPFTPTQTIATHESQASPPQTDLQPPVDKTSGHPLLTANSESRTSKINGAEDKMREDFLKNASSPTPESSYFTGIGTLKMGSVALNISKSSKDRRSSSTTSTILELHIPKPKNPDVAFAIDYPYPTGGRIHVLKKDEIFVFPNFEIFDTVLIFEGCSVHMGQVYDRTVWVNVANKNSSLRALCKDRFEMSSYNDSQGMPIRFREEDLQPHHDVGTLLLLAHDDDFVIGIVTGQITTSDPLNIDVIIAKDLLTDAKIRFQNLSVRRTHRMRKVILLFIEHFLS
jgi:hypothetical protein